MSKCQDAEEIRLLNERIEQLKFHNRQTEFLQKLKTENDESETVRSPSEISIISMTDSEDDQKPVSEMSKFVKTIGQMLSKDDANENNEISAEFDQIKSEFKRFDQKLDKLISLQSSTKAVGGIFGNGFALPLLLSTPARFIIPGEGFAPGKTLLISGIPEKMGHNIEHGYSLHRFSINLLKEDGDKAFHFNPRFDQKTIVRNTMIMGEWGAEEREAGRIPIEKGISFVLKIVNEKDAFHVFIDGESFCTYAHRLQPHDLYGLQINGDVKITGIQIF